MNITEIKRRLTCQLNSQEAKSIIQFVTGLDQKGQVLNYGKNLTSYEEREILTILEKRKGGFPLQYILGSWSFMGANYTVGPGVLIPRDDTEVVVTSVIPFLQKQSKPKIIDLCAGTGIISITLNRMFKDAQVYALELSERAIPYLEENIRNLAPEVKLCKGDLKKLYSEFDDENFDLIISNPPYIKSSELTSLQKEVQKEPAMALDGGYDGLDFYRDILELWTPKLKRGGMLAFELGEEQFSDVKTMMADKSFTNIMGYRDLGIFTGL